MAKQMNAGLRINEEVPTNGDHAWYGLGARWWECLSLVSREGISKVSARPGRGSGIGGGTRSNVLMYLLK